jgi:hypothetical protein
VGMRNLHAAENQRAAFLETMNVVADAGHGERWWMVDGGW